MSGTPRVLLQEGVEIRGNPPLVVDVFTPPTDNDRRPALLLLHGGAWMAGDRSQLRGYGFLVGREGFVVVAGDIRLSGAAVWPAQLDDATAMFDWIVKESDTLGVDPNRIAVAGASSGGHLALMLAATRSAHNEVCPAAAISLYGITDVAGAPALDEAVTALFGGPFEADCARQASPLAHVTDRHPPTLLLHSNRDEIVPFRQSLEYYGLLVEMGRTAELALFDGAPHAFDADPQLGRQVAGTIVSFLQRHLSRSAMT
jgi:acetyl esterase/lipase